MRKVTAEWLKSAEMDLENVGHIIHIEHLTPVASFHAQQFYDFAKDVYEQVKGKLGSSQ